MPSVFTYQVAGLWVAADFALPEWADFEVTGSADEMDVTITLDPMPLLDAAAKPTVLEASEHHFSFHVPSAATYHINHGKRIQIRPTHDAGMGEVRLFLLGTAWGILLYQRGLFALHAGVVQVGESAVAFCGPSGSGKSSATAWLAAHGYEFISDDLSCLDLTSETPLVWPSALRLKLWQDTLDAFQWNAQPLQRDHFRLDKFHLPWTASQRRSPLPLRAIYLLAWGDLAIMRLTGIDALRRFVAAATYRGELLESMGKVATPWRVGTQLLSQTPIWEFAHPRDWARMDESMAMLTAHWRQIFQEE